TAHRRVNYNSKTSQKQTKQEPYFTSSTITTSISFLFFFNDTATTEIYTLSLHDALPISIPRMLTTKKYVGAAKIRPDSRTPRRLDRKSTRLNSSHVAISYAVFCLKKKMIMEYTDTGYHMLFSSSFSSSVNR